MRKNKIIKILKKFSAFLAALPLIFSFIFSYFQFPPRVSLADLSFDKEGNFTILAVSGLLEGEAVFSQDTRIFLNSAISKVKPDLTILMGNNILPSPFIVDMFQANTFRMIDSYGEIFDSNQTYFTVLFGDYDMGTLFDKSSQIKRYMRSEFFFGDIASNNNFLTLKENDRDFVANYRVSLLNKGNEEAYLYFIDCQDDIQDEQIAWIQSTANKPSYFFSFSPLYQRENFDIFFEIQNSKAFFSGNSYYMKEDLKDDIHFAEISLCSKVVEGDEVNRRYAAKKIVLTTQGGLFFADI